MILLLIRTINWSRLDILDLVQYRPCFLILMSNGVAFWRKMLPITDSLKVDSPKIFIS